ncbi:LysM peptidoglycan-binding domain-containing protein [Mycobacterium celatum]|uniref:LysM peptidoglycan-binding domain-containing protein n=1 Tax=Mycobacterium celatum TaxID=28045 RepID=A0A1X1RK61_MYCCE|nr:LysM peptidoglycan-binding domain-containing protein [Mycobacterium celatum]ORV07941.1 peptigoglycan-binding protein LysM [Mycobacterium celatum]PIB74880.1 LysM peptidoglycan-binding domain-containing protein [Mycobacterium celatum]
MTVIETIRPDLPRRARPVRVGPAGRRDLRPHGPRPTAPAVAPPRYRGTGVLLSSAPHRPRPITPATTVALALLAAVITVWLGLIAHLGAAVQSDAAGQVPDRLAVVRVEPGETLSHLAARVAPDAPAGQVAERIRQLNGLGTATLAAGQTLIAPVG